MSFVANTNEKKTQEDHLEECVEENVEAGDVYSGISAKLINCSQDSIARKFRDGTPVTSTRRNREVHCYDIDVVKHEGQLWTLNNRSLYAARYFDRKVDINVVDLPSNWEDRFTTDDGGTPRLRG